MAATPTPSTRTAPRVESSWLTEDRLPIAMLLLALCAGALLTPAQNDTWWHLHSGRTMWDTGTLLTTEPFSHASQGQPLDNHWWLTQLAFFALHAVGGPVLLSLAAGLCMCLALVGSLRMTPGSQERRLALLVGLMLCVAPEWSVRPQVVSLALLVAMAYLVLQGRLWALPLVCVLWGNAHAMVIFGVVMACAVFGEALLWSRQHLRSATAVLVGCVAAPMLSPLGWHYWPRVLATVSTSRALALEEYRTPLEWRDLPFWALAAALGWVAVTQRQRLASLARGYRTLLLASAVLALAAISAARNVAFFAVVAVPALGALLGPSTSTRRERPARWPAYVLLGAEAVAAVMFVQARWTQGGRLVGWHPLSAGTLQAVGQCPDPIFNTLEDGGPLMWALDGRKIFVDSRMEAYPQALLVQSRAADVDGQYEALFSRFAFNCAVVVTGSAMDQHLRRDPTMHLAYGDPSRAVFVRATGR